MVKYIVKTMLNPFEYLKEKFVIQKLGQISTKFKYENKINKEKVVKKNIIEVKKEILGE